MKKQIIYALFGIVTLGFPNIQAQDSRLNRIENNVIYGMHSGLALLMDVHIPNKPNGYGIIVIPGSGFHQLMSYDATPLNKSPWYLKNIIGTDNLINHGYTLFVINHRSAPIFRYPAAVEDAQRAVQFIRSKAEEYNISKERLGAIGHSSGAHLVSMLGTLDDIQNMESENTIEKESSKVEAVVTLAGVFDLTSLASGSEGDTGAIASYVGTHLPTWRSSDSPRKNEYDKYEAASSTSYITEDDATFLLVHGTKENVIPTKQSEDFHKKLMENNVNAKLIIIENGGHGLRVNGKVATGKYYKETIDFFDKEIRNKK